MVVLAQELITRAWYLSGLVSRGLQVPSGLQINDGLYLLNALLDWKAVQTDLIPYWTYDESISTAAGQESYFIPNCVAVESVTFNIGVVRYYSENKTRSTYFATGRVDNVESLPFTWTFNRGLGGGTLYMYFIPADIYQLRIMGKFAFTNVTLTTDLTTMYDGSYIEYLRYALAEYMCSEYGIIFNPQSEKKMKEIEYQLMYVEGPDLKISKTSILINGPPINFGDVNIGMGYRPG